MQAARSRSLECAAAAQGGPNALKPAAIRPVTLPATPHPIIAFAQTKPLREVLPFIRPHHELPYPREISRVACDGDLTLYPLSYTFDAGLPDHMTVSPR